MVPQVKNMYQIVEKKTISENTKMMKIKAPLIAKKAKPGQFIILRIDEKGERIPLTIADQDKKKGTITIIFLEIGRTTKKLGSLNTGDTIKNVAGPLGIPSDIKKYGNVICIGGGVGIAPLYPIIKALKEKNNYIILILEKEIKKISDELHITTDDGSKGHHGFVSDILQQILNKKQKKIDLVMAIGPVIMMKVISNITKKHGIKTLVSLNPIMIDGTGMCGGCRVIINGKTKFACVDGPEFDGHQVDYDNLILRNQRFIQQEKEACKHHNITTTT